MIINPFSPPQMTTARYCRMLAIAARTSAYVAAEQLLQPKARRLDDVPCSLDAVTPAWLSEVICRGHPDAQVTGFERSAGSSGTSERARYTVRYNRAGEEAGYPATVFAKASPTVLTRMSNGVSGTMVQEGRFYNELRDSLPKAVEAPKGYHSAWDIKSFRSIHVLEDLVSTKGARFCEPTTVVDRAQAEQLVTLLATLHGGFGGESELSRTDSTLEAYPWLTTYPQWWHNNLLFFDIKGTAEKGILRAQAHLPESVFRQRDRLWEGFLASISVHSELPQSLLHGDVHMGNWYITDAGAMGLCDWQCISLGHWSRDFAYALATALTVDNRRAWERDLLTAYLDVLAQKTGERPSFDVAWDWYRLQLFGALMMWAPTYHHSVFLPDMQPDNVSEEMLRRIGSALDDLDAFSVIDKFQGR